MTKESKEEESKSGKREVQGERERFEGKRICLDCSSSKTVEVLCPESEVWGVGNFLSFSVCLLVVPPSLPVVTFPCSNVNVVCQGFFFSDSNCEFVEPQIFSLSRTREASVARESETDMHIEGPPIKAVPESVREDPRRKVHL